MAAGQPKAFSTTAASQAKEDALWWEPLSAAADLIDPPPPRGAEHTEQVSNLFDELDEDNSGTVTAEELQSALKKVGLPASRDYIDELLRQYDHNRDGEVDAREFEEYVARKESAMWRAFKELDVSKDGSLQEEELMRAMQSMGMPCKIEDTERMIQLLDRDGDSQISFEEFRRFVVLLPANQLSHGNIVASWIDSADWMAGVEFRLSMTPPQQLTERLLAGGVAGAVSRTAVAPLERLRTMMMADARNTRITSTAAAMWRDGGVRGLFKGNLATVVKTIPQCAIQMAVFDTVKDAFQNRNPGQKLTNTERLTAGIAAGAASTIVTYPMENLRTHVSLGRTGGYLKILSEIYQTRGWPGVYGGFMPCMVNTVSTTGLGFLSYEIGCDIFRTYIAERPRQPTPGERGVIAGCSAIAVMTATMPLEVVTRRMQVQGSPGHPVKYRGLADCFAVMAREEGLKSFYRGTISSYMKVVPAIACVRYLYEVINSFSGTKGIRNFRTPRESADA